ncbi:MAG: glycosyltransferase family 4 protein [Granulosicoccus sp.]|nr:glycosyltransferase family 4 protein [Granulosicoccus sp.]
MAHTRSLPSLHFVFPGDINTRTGGYRYDKRIMEELGKLGWAVRPVSLTGDFPFPDDKTIAEANKTLTTIQDGSLVLVDGLAFSALPELIRRHHKRLRLIALIHHPLALETGLNKDQKLQLAASEKQALSYVDRIITTSSSTAITLENYEVNSKYIVAVPPGTDLGSVTSPSGHECINLLCVATLTPRKGHALLFEALADLQGHTWHMICAGSIQRDADTYTKLVQQLEDTGLSDRVSLVGELDDQQLDSQYRRADVFVLASHHEGYGMVLDEAIAYGLPIVCTDAGAMKETVPKNAALVVPANDKKSLADALENIVTNKVLRDNLTHQSFLARNELRSWKQAGREFDLALKQ